MNAQHQQQYSGVPEHGRRYHKLVFDWFFHQGPFGTRHRQQHAITARLMVFIKNSKDALIDREIFQWISLETYLAWRF